MIAFKNLHLRNFLQAIAIGDGKHIVLSEFSFAFQNLPVSSAKT